MRGFSTVFLSCHLRLVLLIEGSGIFQVKVDADIYCECEVMILFVFLWGFSEDQGVFGRVYGL